METLQIVRNGQGEHLLVVTDVVTIKASNQATNGTMLTVEVRVPPGGGPPILHRHTPTETFFILEGTFEINTADPENRLTTYQVGSGDSVTVPAMVWHNYKNVGSTPGRFIAMQSPGGMEAFFREIGRPLEDPLNPPKPSGPPSDEQRQKMMAIIMKYMEVLPPDKIVR